MNRTMEKNYLIISVDAEAVDKFATHVIKF